jgi:hypothetical protein
MLLTVSYHYEGKLPFEGVCIGFGRRKGGSLEYVGFGKREREKEREREREREREGKKNKDTERNKVNDTRTSHNLLVIYGSY